MAEVLVVEDDKAIQKLLKIALKQENHDVIAVSSAREGIDYAIKGTVDLVILDLGLPDMDGINVVKTIREFNEKMPIIIVSARGDEQEKIKCLDAGVNDYVEKPFSSAELMARIRAALRYAIAGDIIQNAVFVNGDLKIDFSAHIVFVKDKEVHLTNLEYKLLCVLAHNVGKTLTQNYIITKVWGAGGNDANGLRVFMASIRRKIEKDPYTQELIRTEVGVGYRMNKV
ncbi:MAG: response regulator transcription factor [Eubacteriales bacterium]